MGEAKRRRKSDAGKAVPQSVLGKFVAGFLAVDPALRLKLKAAAKLAGMVAMAKVRANFRKWNRGETGKRDDGKKD
jgi:hypothetical protein